MSQSQEKTVAKIRPTYENKDRFKSNDSAFSNKSKEQRSMKDGGSAHKKQKQSKTTPERRAASFLTRTASEVLKNNHLLVALIDQNVQYGKITREKAKVVEMKMLDAMIQTAQAQMPTFDSS